MYYLSDDRLTLLQTTKHDVIIYYQTAASVAGAIKQRS
jgi:hypothetical protein